MKKLYEFKQLLLIIAISLVSLSSFAQSQQYSSIEEVKKLNSRDLDIKRP